ncbi:HD domain-containing protein [Pseudomonas sp. SbB1]|uniref:5'-deoxynucleotidase n=1 Tax=Pseudomonas putida (strain GB-1) TaxID=76869 RepID=B0KNT5_PSEPG|nr:MULTISPECIES: HD domain-containing protein [Pseudomonas]MCK2186668.1 HD domain-containing protein [Pseudomonas sp. MB04B]NOG88879.1 HD domain-containing protein [Pseudomonas sp. SbB1]ABY99614.1 metal dependent phosphohydrolase [Pseudomonas putida GB-1]MDD2083225.1 HD domain-containing protein [Pseudomonas putida]MDD2093873.1 HD domain-containing protein [Pseudomonas putida]
MPNHNLDGKLDFLRQAEKLKSVTRSAHTSTGRRESTAEHSWRLALLALVFEQELGDVDICKVLKLCLVHDLGEALSGDVPAPQAHAVPDKGTNERQDLVAMTSMLEPSMQDSIVGLFDEYEAASTPEAKVVKALDKIETLLQHTQGDNPPGFDYAFNLEYGRRYTDAIPFLASLRRVIDEETRKRLNS